jgi:hypothetical protein
MDYNCIFCSISFKRNCDLNKHKNTLKCKENKKRNEDEKEIKNKINTIEKELQLYKNRDNDNCNKIKLLEIDNNKLKKQNEEKDIQIKLFQEKYEDLRKIVEKAATKSTVKNYTHNNYLNYISTEPIKFNELKSQVRQIVNCETVMYNDSDFHDHIVDNILKDKSGKDKVLCTDINRKNFTYKDEKSGELISDPELERLREKLKKGTDIRQIRRDLLEKLVNEYEENGSIGMDPYKQFSDIIQKLNFGSPFIEHVAKKTYIKSKNGFQENINEFNELESIYEWNDKSEEEYQKLLEEFGTENV